MMTISTFIFLQLLVSLLISECGFAKSYEKDIKTTLVDQFNDYVDRTIDIINNKHTTSSRLPNYFTTGTWGYLLLDVDYTLKLYNGSLAGISKMRRSGDAFINYNKTTGNLTISASVASQQVQASYTVEVKVYGISHRGEVISNVPALNISVGLSVNAANLRVSLDHISVATTQAPNVTFSSTNPVLSYFAPLITDVSTLSNLTVAAVVQSSIQTTIDVLNSPSFGYY